MPQGIHHLEAWNEAVCAGRWGRVAAGLAERLRRAVDLEHWSAFNTSFERLCDWLRRVSEGTDTRRPPATILLLGGDVHNAYVSEVALGTADEASRVFQIVCSPYRNRLASRERRIVRITRSKGAAVVFSFLARLAGVPPASADWGFVRRPTFDNSIGSSSSTVAPPGSPCAEVPEKARARSSSSHSMSPSLFRSSQIRKDR